MEESGNWFDRGVALFDQQDYTGAIAAFDKAIAFNQRTVDAWASRGLACAQAGKYEQALSSFEQALSLDPDHEAATRAKAMVLSLMEKQRHEEVKPAAPSSPFRRHVPPAPVAEAPRQTVASTMREPLRNPLLAVIFSFLFPGWGQWYNGSRYKGLFFLGISIILGMLNIIQTFVLRSQIIWAVFAILGTGFWIYGMYDAYSTARMINRGEIGFTQKSRLFWIPVALFVAMIVILIVSFVLAFMVFGMVGNTHHTKVVAATASQPDSSTIKVTYQGGQDASLVRQVTVILTDSGGTIQTRIMGEPGSSDPLPVGTSIAFTGLFKGKDHVVATARFKDGTEQVIYDSYL